jgi:lipopolysaccharide export system permease protein
MIVERYLFRELAYTLIGVALLLTLIILSGTFVRILAEAADGSYPKQLVFTLFALKSIPNLAVVLPLAFLLAVLLALGRFYKDSEMVVLAACGIGPEKVVRVVTFMSIVVGLIVALFTLWIVPATQDHSQKLLDEAAARAEIEGIAAGRFNTTSDGNQLIYAEEISSDRRVLSNLFGYSRDSTGRMNLIAAERANQHTNRETGDRYLVLENGYRYEGKPGAADFRIIRFAAHGVRIEERAVAPSKRALYSQPTSALMGSDKPADAAELQWRISLPISTILLGLLAVPLAKTNPRQGRYGRLFAGIMVYVIYNNLMTVGRAWVNKGEVPTWVGMWWVHALVFVLVLILLDRHSKMPLEWRIPGFRRKATS